MVQVNRSASFQPLPIPARDSALPSSPRKPAGVCNSWPVARQQACKATECGTLMSLVTISSLESGSWCVRMYLDTFLVSPTSSLDTDRFFFSFGCSTVSVTHTAVGNTHTQDNNTPVSVTHTGQHTNVSNTHTAVSSTHTGQYTDVSNTHTHTHTQGTTPMSVTHIQDNTLMLVTHKYRTPHRHHCNTH